MELQDAYKLLKGHVYSVAETFNVIMTDEQLDAVYHVIVDNPKTLIKSLGINAKDIRDLDGDGVLEYVCDLIRLNTTKHLNGLSLC